MSKCNKCDQEVSPDAKFCPNCGTAIPLVTDPKNKVAQWSAWEQFAKENPRTAKLLKDNSRVIVAVGVVIILVLFLSQSAVFSPNPDRAKEEMIRVAKEMGQPYLASAVIQARESGAGWAVLDSTMNEATPELFSAYQKWRDAERRAGPRK